MTDDELIDELELLPEHTLSAWEIDFIDDIVSLKYSDKSLTEAQREKAMQILEERG